MSDIERTKQNWEFLKANPTAHYPAGWAEEVRREAIAAGIVKQAFRIGSNCKPGIDSRITYGGDMVEAF